MSVPWAPWARGEGVGVGFTVRSVPFCKSSRVSGSATPVASRPCISWNSRMAVSVAGPSTPSATPVR